MLVKEATGEWKLIREHEDQTKLWKNVFLLSALWLAITQVTNQSTDQPTD